MSRPAVPLPELQIQKRPIAIKQRGDLSTQDRLAISTLVAVTALTRLPAFAARPGETDSALFIVGLRQWVEHGSHAPKIYGRVLSAGYYGLSALLERALPSHAAHFALLLNSISFVAAIATAWLVYAVSRRLLLPLGAAIATGLLMLAPGMWWLGIEPHPQGLSIALWLASLLCFARAWGFKRRSEAGSYQFLRRRASLKWICLSAAVLAVSFSVRADLVLLLGAFPALLWFAEWRLHPLPLRRWIHMTFTAVMVAAAAAAAFLLLREAILHEAIAASLQSGGREVEGYLGGLNPLKQLLPIMFSPGLFVWAFIAGGVFLGARLHGVDWLLRWGAPVVAMSLPGYLFWALIRGNNARHVAVLVLPLLWIAIAGWQAVGRRWPALAAAAAAAVLLNFAIPPNSNVALYPSPNVIASAAMLNARERQMSALARQLTADALAGRAAPVCYLGSTTSPYLLNDVMALQDLHPGAPRAAAGLTLEGRTLLVPVFGVRRRAELEFTDVYSGPEYVQFSRSCGVPATLEYDANGRKRWYFGNEWARLPLVARFAHPTSRPSPVAARRAVASAGGGA
jgi:hypothetical protein